MVFDLQRNAVIAGAPGPGNDGCNETLADVADRYENDEKNTPWQRIVIKAIQAGRVV
jgi:hypothetical protein